MSDRTFNSVVQRLIPHVPGCPHPIVEQYVRDAAIDCCERSLSWRYMQPLIRLTPGVYDYPYELPTQADIHAFLTVTLNDRPMHVETLETITARFPGWPDYDPASRGTPRHIFQLDSRNFGVLPIPDDTQIYDLRMVVALKPLRDANRMNKNALDELENAIMHGALKQLLLMPDKNWSDPRLASFHAGQYLARVTERRARANLGAGRASLTVQMRPLA